MLDESDLQELLKYQAQHPVLSLYLNTDTTQGSADGYKLQLRGMLKSINLPEDVAAVEHYFDREFDWSGRSVAVFSCAPEDFFRAYSLAVPLRSRVRMNNSPHVKPLVTLLDYYGGYGVALVDKQGARLFYFHMGELREQEGMMGEEVRRTKRGGASAVAGRRGGVAGQTHYVEEIEERNMKEAAEFAARFFSENNVRRVLIGGTEDNVVAFRRLLPKSWQSLVVGTFPMAMTASKDEVQEKALQSGRMAEIRNETRLVDLVVTNAAKRKGGVIQLDDTLKAVQDGRVQTLLIKEGYRAPGYECKSCGYLTAQPVATCPYCGGDFKQITDAVEMAVRKVMQQSGDVEVLQTEQAANKLGSIGAILRY